MCKKKLSGNWGKIMMPSLLAQINCGNKPIAVASPFARTFIAAKATQIINLVELGSQFEFLH